MFPHFALMNFSRAVYQKALRSQDAMFGMEWKAFIFLMQGAFLSLWG
jgi:hypothetical protein